MKVLIAYDPALHEPMGIADLRRAAFPSPCHVLVVAVADVLPPPASEETTGTPAPVPPRVQAEIDKAGHAAADVQAQLQMAFPAWTITIDAVADAPAWGIIRKAEGWQPDVIVIGAHRQSALSRLVLGSVSQTVLHEVTASVRVVKGGTIDTGRSPRVLVGVDGSHGADAAVAAVTARQWPSGTAVHVVTVIDPASNPSETRAIDEIAARARLEHIARELADRGLTLSINVLNGDPRQALLAEAETWGADCIFVGARGLNVVERLLLGSVSATLAARATCSVEVVRPQRHA